MWGERVEGGLLNWLRIEPRVGEEPLDFTTRN